MASNGVVSPGVRVSRFRDLLCWVDGGSTYVLACDSNAGIGRRPHDALDQSPFDTGYSAAKVPLMEVLASGAVPFVLANALGGPRDEYGRQILAGIAAAIAEVDAAVELTGSDETNVETGQTAVGVTVLGRASGSGLRLGRARPGDAVVVVGVPKDGLIVPYTEGTEEIANVRDLRLASELPFVHEILPVGSRGVRYEAMQLADGARAELRLHDGVQLDLSLSAGASTCFLVALPRVHVGALAAAVRPPVTDIGEIAGT
jgi:hypothetical protein